MKMNRRSFIIGLFATGTAAVAPLAFETTAEAFPSTPLITDPDAAKLLSEVLTKWDSLANYYSFDELHRFLIPHISYVDITHSYFKYTPPVKKINLVQDEWFAVDKDEIVANYKIADIWYSVRLAGKENRFTNVIEEKETSEYVKAAAQYITYHQYQAYFNAVKLGK